MENGVVYDLTLFNGFTYKGAVSMDFTYCYCYDKMSNHLEGLTNKEYPQIYKEKMDFTMTDEEWDVIEDIASDFALLVASAELISVAPLILTGVSITMPFIAIPLVIASILVIAGIGLKYDANNKNLGKAI